jgi:hypothetical protein
LKRDLEIDRLVLNATWPAPAVTPEELGTADPTFGAAADFIAAQIRDR